MSSKLYHQLLNRCHSATGVHILEMIRIGKLAFTPENLAAARA